MLGVAFVFQVYMLWLNWKQSKVKDTTTKLLKVAENIELLLKKQINKP